MMKIYKLAMIALMGVATLSSCAKEENNGNGEKERSVSVVINNGVVTKGIDDPVTGTENKSDYSDLYIYLTDGTKVISCDLITTEEDVATFKTSGKTYDNISASVSKVLIVANVKTADSGLPVAAGTAVTAVKNFAFSLATQQPIAANPENKKANGLKVTMYGEGEVVDDVPEGRTVTTLKKADVSLEPVVARIEVANAPVAGEGIHSVTVSHIYLNNYYSLRSYIPANLVDNGTEISEYTGNLQDAYTEEAIAGTKAASYHLFADGTNTSMPSMILKVSGYYDNAGVQGTQFTDQYVTVTRYSGITKITANNVYKIDLSDLTIPATAIDPSPETGKIDLEVNVTVASWNIIDVTPEI